MASADITIRSAFATIEVDTTQRTATLVGNPHVVLTNVNGTNAVRIGMLGETLAAESTVTNADGQTSLLAGESMVLPRGIAGFTYRSVAGATLRVTNGAAP